MKIAIIIPTLNEEKNLSVLLPRLTSYFSQALIFVIDDGDDDTAKIAREHGAFVSRSLKKRGLSNSYREGLELALAYDCDVIAIMDADHPARALRDMALVVDYLGADIVIGKELGTRSTASKVAGFLAKRYLGIKGVDQPTCGLMMFTAELAKKVDFANVKAKSDAFHLEMLYRAIKCGAKVRQVYFYGHAKHEQNSVKRVFRWLWELFLMRWRQRKAYKP